MSDATNSERPPLRVALAGLGAIGSQLAATLNGQLPGFTLAAVAVRDRQKARAQLNASIPVVRIDELEPLADIVIECAPASLLASIVNPFVSAGKKALVLSCGALLRNPELVETARRHGGQIIVPSGALLGLDAVGAAAQGKIYSVKMITRKPVTGLLGAPYLEQNNIQIDNITEPLKIFSGTARDAAAGFPANVNVAVALSLAGIGPDATHIEIWADPALTRNTHHIEVDADSARFSMTIENIPSDNPKTGKITALSAIAALRKLRSALQVGS